MIRRHMIMSAAAATIALSSCSGDKDSPTPTPTSTATPTPTPTASPSYVALPLAAATEFFTFNAETSYTGDPATSAVTLGPIITETFTNRVRLATTNAYTTGEFVVRSNTEESRYTNANLSTPPVATNTEFVYSTTDTATPGKFTRSEFLNNLLPATPSVVTTDPLFSQLNRVSYVSWQRGDSTAGQKRLTYATFGYGTAGSDMPKTGTSSYTTKVVGRVVSTSGATTTINRVAGTVTFTINFTTGAVDATLVLTQGATGTEAAYTTVTLSGGIPAGQNQFSGAFGAGGPLTGTFTGGCFGSQCEEIGVTFAAQGTVGGAQQRLIGVIVGQK